MLSRASSPALMAAKATAILRVISPSTKIYSLKEEYLGGARIDFIENVYVVLQETYILMSIEGKPWRQRNVTITEVARVAGVSIATVSRVLNNSPGVGETTRRRIRALIDELGYHPNLTARSLASQSTRTIAVISMQTLGQLQTQPALGQLFRGIEDVLARENYRCTVLSRDEFKQSVAGLRLVKGSGVDGVLLNGAKVNDPFATELASYGFPFVTIGRAIGLVNTYYVDIDNLSGAYEAVKTLVRAGHKRIGHVCGSQQTNLGIERLEGYRRALIDAGLEYNERLVVEAGMTRRDAYIAVDAFLRSTDRRLWPTGIFVFNDFFAISVVKALADNGLCVPQDISVIGFDDDDASQYLNPPLASVRAPIYQLGEQATRMLLSLVRGEEIARPQVILPTEVVSRASIGPPPV